MAVGVAGTGLVVGLVGPVDGVDLGAEVAVEGAGLVRRPVGGGEVARPRVVGAGDVGGGAEGGALLLE